MLASFPSRPFRPWKSAPEGHFARPLLLLLTLALLFQTLPLRLPLPAAEQPDVARPVAQPATPATPAYALPDQLVGKAEVAALRTANSATFNMGDGSYALLQDIAPLHYQAADGSWQPINPAFAATPTGWINRTNTLRTSLEQRSSRAHVGTTSAGVDWQPAGLELTAAGRVVPVAAPVAGATPGIRSADGRTVRYSESWSAPGVQDQWWTRRGAAEYSMRLPALPAAGDSAPESLDLRVTLHLRPGTTIQAGGRPIALPLETRNVLSFVAADGETMQLLPPYAYEQDRPEIVAAGSYALAATADPSVVELRVRTDWGWLAAPERHFPVIIDPLFQMRNSTFAATAYYAAETGVFQSNVLNTAMHLLGRGSSITSRPLLRFDIPPMPSGSAITKAYLLATPSSVDDGRSYLSDRVYAYALTSDAWQTSVSASPAFDSQHLLPPGGQTMSYSSGDREHKGLVWDVTSAATGWLPAQIQTNNPGILLRTEHEFCDPDQFFTIFQCGGFWFNELSQNWTEDDLEMTQSGSTPDAPLATASEQNGFRLIVFYNGPTLQEGQIVDMNSVGGALPPSDNAPYYKADHAYTIPAVPNDRWQAIVARGFGPPVGVNPPIANGQSFKLPLKSAIPMHLRSWNDAVEWRNVLPDKGQAGYILLNGRGAPFPASNLGYQLRAGSPADEDLPTGYDLRLIKEQGTLVTSLAFPGMNKRTINYTFDSADPLALWNLSLPANSNNQITIKLNSDGTQAHSFFSYAKSGFSASIVNSANQLDLPSSDANAYNRQHVEIGADTFITQLGGWVSPTFSRQAGQYALALAYNGPQLAGYEISDCGNEFCPTQTIHIKYNLTVEVLSCAAGSYPTPSGACQKVECPTLSFPAGNHRTAGNLELWSAAGWSAQSDVAESLAGANAPLIGPPGNVAPTVAIVGGTLYYDRTKTPDVVTVSPLSKVMLIACQAPGANVTAVGDRFDVFIGALELQSSLIGGPVLVPAPSGGVQLADPWPAGDKVDLSNTSFSVRPNSSGIGRAGGSAQLRRRLGQGPILYTDLMFDTSWSWTAQGWLSLVGQATAKAGNPSPPRVASLILGLGNDFKLDAPPAVDAATARRFEGLRAMNATITQQPQFGGASKPVKAVILPRGAFMPSETPVSCMASCLDLRAASETEYHDPPNRTWEMPDVHSNTQANTVMLKTDGAVQVYSTDHPAISPQGGIAEEYSFDAYKASVSVEQAPCEKGGPVVTVIRGETRMALPNIGDTSGDPSAAISAGFKLCESSLRSIHMSFQSALGIPIGNSGLFLTGLNGEIDVFPSYTTVTFGLDFQAAQGGNGGLFKAHGEVTIDTRGLFAFQGQATILGVVDAEGKIWVAWNPLDTGFEVDVRVGDWLEGFERAHMWEGQGWQHRYSWLPDDNEKHAAGEIGATLKIPEGAIVDWEFLTLPPDDISIGVNVAFGQFCTNSSCTSYEWGIKGSFEVLGYDVGLYYGFDEGLDFILGNDDHILIDQYGGAQTSPVAALSAADAPVRMQAAPQASNGEALIPLNVKPGAEQILVGLGWQAGAPKLNLINPDGVAITMANAAAHKAQFGGTGNSVLITVQAPKAGAWQARISGLSDAGVEHYKFMYLANKGAPGMPGNRGAFLKPVAENEKANGSYPITWKAPDDTPDTATISLYYRRTTAITGNLELDVPIVKNLPFKAGGYNWNTVGLLNGSYIIRAEVDDGINALPKGAATLPDDSCTPLSAGLPRARAFDTARFPGTSIFTATGTVFVNDIVPPPVPAGLQLSTSDGAILARWNAAPQGDTSQYLVRWGPRTGNTFTAQNQSLVTAAQTPALRIGAVNSGVQYGVDIQAIDVNGNHSTTTAPAFVTPNAASNPAPLTPIDFKRTGGTATSALFAWGAPAGPAPASYRLTYVKLGPNAKPAFKSVSGLGASITGLEAGATYDVTVSAANSDGWRSVDSAPIRVVAGGGGDANGDGLPDAWATAHGVSGASADPDGDGVPNSAEFTAGSDPAAQDSDADGRSDAEELMAKTDPLVSASHAAEISQPRLWLERKHVIMYAKRQPGGEAAPQLVAWRNTGGGTLKLKATTSESWLTAAIVGSDVKISMDSSMLAPGFYSGILSLAAGAGSDALIGKPSCIRVNTWVMPADTDVPAPRIDSLEPAQALQGAENLTLIVRGTNFHPDAAVQWNGAKRPTTFVNGGELRAAIAAADLAAAGQAGVTVVNPGTSSGPSNALSFVIADPAKQSQTITFGPLPDRALGASPFQVTATASSGLPVSFTAGGACSVAGNTVTLNSVGACTIIAHQPGDATYNPAPDVATTFQVVAALAAPPTLSLYLPLVAR